MPIGDDFKDPADGRIARAEFKQEHGRKWSAKTSVDKAKSMLHLLGITGITSTRRGNVTFSALVKSISSMRREKHYGLGWSKAHTGRSREIKSKQEVWMK